MIVADTSLLSVLLRHKRTGLVTTPHADVFRQMVTRGVPPGVPGIVVQEILSGVKTDAQFAELGNALRRFPLLLARTSDHLFAAGLFNTCKRHGSATLVDCLIAAQTIANGARLWTLDQDFARIARHSELVLFTPENVSQNP
ncbi:MAG: PIN domain-containing protein [Candidatus Acidiferrales bacterium]